MKNNFFSLFFISILAAGCSAGPTLTDADGTNRSPAQADREPAIQYHDCQAKGVGTLEIGSKNISFLEDSRSPDGRYVPFYTDHQLQLVDTQTMRVTEKFDITSLQLGQNVSEGRGGPEQPSLQSIAWSPSGKYFIARSGVRAFQKFILVDRARGKIKSDLPGYPYWAKDENDLLVTDVSNELIHVYDPSAAQSKTIAAPGLPTLRTERVTSFSGNIIAHQDYRDLKLIVYSIKEKRITAQYDLSKYGKLYELGVVDVQHGYAEIRTRGSPPETRKIIRLSDSAEVATLTGPDGVATSFIGANVYLQTYKNGETVGDKTTFRTLTLNSQDWSLRDSGPYSPSRGISKVSDSLYIEQSITNVDPTVHSQFFLKSTDGKTLLHVVSPLDGFTRLEQIETSNWFWILRSPHYASLPSAEKDVVGFYKANDPDVYYQTIMGQALNTRPWFYDGKLYAVTERSSDFAAGKIPLVIQALQINQSCQVGKYRF